MNRFSLPLQARRGRVALLRVFTHGPGGGNPVPLVADASGMDAQAMRGIAREYGHESAFVLPAETKDGDFRFRFFVPEHEMEMCGHATVGTLWAMRQWGVWRTDTARIETASGVVDAHWDHVASRVWISQPPVSLDKVASGDQARVALALGIPAKTPGLDIVNACTSRVKTLVRLPDTHMLDTLEPDFASMENLCAAIGSTGLYPYAIEEDAPDRPARIHARQFPKASGYPEDAATGIAAAALWGYLAQSATVSADAQDVPHIVTILQGQAMGRPSAIQVKPRHDIHGGAQGCWLSGEVEWQEE